jgi:hypothetical protein
LLAGSYRLLFVEDRDQHETSDHKRGYGEQLNASTANPATHYENQQ